MAWQHVSGLANSGAAEQNGLGQKVYDDGGASNWHCHPSVCAVQLLLLLSYCNSTCLYIRVAEGRQKYHQYPIFNIICRQPCPHVHTLNPAIYLVKPTTHQNPAKVPLPPNAGRVRWERGLSRVLVGGWLYQSMRVNCWVKVWTCGHG